MKEPVSHNKYTGRARATDTLVVDPRTGIALEYISTWSRAGGETGVSEATLISQGWTNRGPGLHCLRGRTSNAGCIASIPR